MRTLRLTPGSPDVRSFDGLPAFVSVRRPMGFHCTELHKGRGMGRARSGPQDLAVLRKNFAVAATKSTTS